MNGQSTWLRESSTIHAYSIVRRIRICVSFADLSDLLRYRNDAP